jgi:hypothetical protein
MIVFYWTESLLALLFVGSLLSGTTFTGDNIIVLGSLIAAVGGMFFGANFGEHWSQKK